MKTNIIKTTTIVIAGLLMLTASCKKKKDPAPVPEPIPPANGGEVITTFKLVLTDSASNLATTYFFKDPDGDGGQPAFYGPTNTTQTDSVFTLAANKTFYGEIFLLDETKNPVDTISKEVNNEGQDHMLFYNNGNNTILNAGNPYTVLLNTANIKITYTDLDSGSPQRGIGLKTKWRTSTSTGIAKHPLNITLRHQPAIKNGTFAPGNTDISVDFKVMVN